MKNTIIPKNQVELIKIIEEEIFSEGNNCDLNHINTSSITDMNNLFSDENSLHYFNGDISQWNTFNVKNMQEMFYNSHFNGDISKWNTSNVTTMKSMFYNSQFNQDISNWNTSSVTNMSSMFYNSHFNQDISLWSIENVVNIKNMFKNSNINEIPKWNYFQIHIIKNCFDDCSELIESLPDWYQFNYIEDCQERQKTYNDYLFKKNFNNFISNNIKKTNNLKNKI